jgi:hypothetical protein
MYLWQEDSEESALLVHRGSMRPTMWQETQVRNPFLPEALPSTGTVRGCNHALYSTLWSQEDSLRTRLLRSMPRPLPLQRDNSLPSEDIHHLRMSKPKTTHQVSCLQNLTRQFNQNARLQRRMSQTSTKCEASCSSQHRSCYSYQ